MAGVLDQPSHVTAALPIFIMAGISGVTAIVLRHVSPRRTARGGLTALIVGLAAVLVALAEGSTALFLLGSAICGLGFGPAFAGVFRSLTSSAPADGRASLVSSILTVSYLAFSVPAVAAGVAVTQLGLEETAEIYGAVLIALAGLALVLSGALEPAGATAAEAEAVEAAVGRAA
jgi:MFS family permease